MKRRDGESDEDYAVRLEAFRERDRNKPSRKSQSYREKQREGKRKKYASDPEKVRGQWRDRSREYKVRNRLAEIDACGNPDRCQCCRQPFRPTRGGSDGRCVDHDHESQAVRGVLCSRCNTERGAVEAALREGRLALHLAAIEEHAAPIRTPRRSDKRVVKGHPSLFEATAAVERT